MGLGVGDPKNIFETTEGLQKKFGKKRVFDVPCSENALTGICIGYGIKKKQFLLTNVLTLCFCHSIK